MAVLDENGVEVTKLSPTLNEQYEDEKKKLSFLKHFLGLVDECSPLRSTYFMSENPELILLGGTTSFNGTEFHFMSNPDGGYDVHVGPVTFTLVDVKITSGEDAVDIFEKAVGLYTTIRKATK